MSKKHKAKKKEKPTGAYVVAENRKARHKYEILEQVECGIVLFGSEIKSIRNGRVSLDEAYGRIRDGELYLIGCDIGEYMQASTWNHLPKRARKLLVHNRQLKKLSEKAHEGGLTLVPLRLLINERGLAKLILAVGRGKKVYDKRETLKKADIKRDIARAMRRK
jgi:SsrA-binding protein